MLLPNLSSRIDRRILFNLRVRPEYWRQTNRIPERFRPVEVKGWTIAGVCLIRLSRVRPKFFPESISGSTEGAAFRVACVDTQAADSRCVAILNRWTNSFFVRCSDVITPMQHERAEFESLETGNEFELTVRLKHSSETCSIKAKRSRDWPADSVFDSVDEASNFFKEESQGHTVSASASGECSQCIGGVALNVHHWTVTPLAIENGSFPWLPADSCEIDHALLMEDANSTWEWFSDRHDA